MKLHLINKDQIKSKWEKKVLSFKREKNTSQRKNSLVECAQGDQPVRSMPTCGDLPWWWCDVFWCGLLWGWDEALWLVVNDVSWGNMVSCKMACHVMLRDAMRCYVMWSHVMNCHLLWSEAMQWNGIFWACDAMWLVERLDYGLKVSCHIRIWREFFIYII